jgi:hypothetical protein
MRVTSILGGLNVLSPILTSELFKSALERGINTRGDNGKGRSDEQNLNNAKDPNNVGRSGEIGVEE